MNFLAFHLNHDANISISKNGEINYSKFERFTGEKHACTDINFVNDCLDKWDSDRNFEAVAFDELTIDFIESPNKTFEKFHDKLGFLSNLNIETKNIYCLDHHTAHALSGFPIIPSKELDWAVSIDGEGNHGKRKQIIKLRNNLPEIIHYSKAPQFPLILETLGNFIGLDCHPQDIAGKVMGAQAYGEVNHKWVKEIEGYGNSNHLINHISQLPIFTHRFNGKQLKLDWNGFISEGLNFEISNQHFRDYLASVHHVLDKLNVQFFSKYFDKHDKISYTGGGCQNVIFNQSLSENFSNIHFIPHCYDGGCSLGSLEFLRILHNQPEFDISGFPFWQDDEHEVDVKDEIIEEVSNLLMRNKIVGWFIGKGEIGPRALGHRSILANPSNKNIKEIINKRVKHREWYRPFAPSILESQAKRYFNFEGESPYMLRAVEAKEITKNLMPGIVHEDNTSRIQTIPDNPRQDSGLIPFSKLLKSFFDKSGIPALLNTSLNINGYPIMSNTAPAMELVENGSLDALVTGNQLYVSNKGV